MEWEQNRGDIVPGVSIQIDGAARGFVHHRHHCAGAHTTRRRIERVMCARRPCLSCQLLAGVKNDSAHRLGDQENTGILSVRLAAQIVQKAFGRRAIGRGEDVGKVAARQGDGWLQPFDHALHHGFCAQRRL
ncbi:MAG: hypothetical protein IPM07_06140 [Anaerolineales bacterium]|nr:hypothetical protein [Anaerolineales bacterium]